MSGSQQVGNRYWALIEPWWLPLNQEWASGPARFLSRFGEAPPKVGQLYAAHWCQSEVCNGGLHQFFSNTTGILAPEALSGFRAIGLREWSEVLEDAMHLFGADYPRDRDVRRSLLPDVDTFSALDQRFYKWLRDGDNGWERAADAYAKDQ
jgi:hypothetical protein